MKAQNGIDTVGDNAFVLEDVPHLTALLPQLTAYPSPIRSSPAYGIVKQSFVTSEDVVAQRVVTYTDCCAKKTVQEGVHFRRAGPREKPEEVCACIVTCGGLCPGINTVIREIVRGLNFLYGVNNIIGIEAARNIKVLSSSNSLDEVLHITGSLIPTHTGCVCWLSKHGVEGGQLIDRNLKRYRVRDVKNEVEDQQPGLSTEHDQSLNHNRTHKSRKRSVED